MFTVSGSGRFSMISLTSGLQKIPTRPLLPAMHYRDTHAGTSRRSDIAANLTPNLPSPVSLRLTKSTSFLLFKHQSSPGQLGTRVTKPPKSSFNILTTLRSSLHSTTRDDDPNLTLSVFQSTRPEFCQARPGCLKLGPTAWI